MYRRVGKIEIQLFRLGLSQLVSVVNIVVYRNVGRIEIQLFRLGLSQLVSVVNTVVYRRVGKSFKLGFFQLFSVVSGTTQCGVDIVVLLIVCSIHHN